MLCLSGFELYSRWVPLPKLSSKRFSFFIIFCSSCQAVKEASFARVQFCVFELLSGALFINKIQVYPPTLDRFYEKTNSQFCLFLQFTFFVSLMFIILSVLAYCVQTIEEARVNFGTGCQYMCQQTATAEVSQSTVEIEAQNVCGFLSGALTTDYL